MAIINYIDWTCSRTMNMLKNQFPTGYKVMGNIPIEIPSKVYSRFLDKIHNKLYLCK